MPVSFVQFYICANVLFVLALVLLQSVRALNGRLRQPLSFRHLLHYGYALIAAAILGPWLATSSGHGDFLPKTTQVWSAPSMRAAPASDAQSASISLATTDATVPLDALTQAIIVICLAGFAIALARILASGWSTWRTLGRAQLIKRSGTLRILSTDETGIPFSFWLPGSHYIVVPSSLIVRPDDLRIALRHEAQHHRQGDTRLLYATELLKGAFFLNPALHVLCRHLRSLQEFACDEALAGRRNLTARAYCDCLLWVAQNAQRGGGSLSCMHMAGTDGPSLLARRIEAVLSKPKRHLQRSAVIAMNTVALAAIVGTGIVLPGTVQDRRVSVSQANSMAAVAQAETPFPIVVNEQVVVELNRLLGTPDGRKFVRDGLQRMSEHHALIAGRLTQNGLPMELLAVPLVESGYRNIPQGPISRHGAGIWMFIKPTARRFGLTVDGAEDERLNIAAETDAAMRMFSRLHSEFNDWSLALLAYNGGTELVRRGVRETGSSDAFQLVQQGYEHDAGYLPRVMAAIIVLKSSHSCESLARSARQSTIAW